MFQDLAGLRKRAHQDHLYVLWRITDVYCCIGSGLFPQPGYHEDCSKQLLAGLFPFNRFLFLDWLCSNFVFCLGHYWHHCCYDWNWRCGQEHPLPARSWSQTGRLGLAFWRCWSRHSSSMLLGWTASFARCSVSWSRFPVDLIQLEIKIWFRCL